MLTVEKLENTESTGCFKVSNCDEHLDEFPSSSFSLLSVPPVPVRVHPIQSYHLHLI